MANNQFETNDFDGTSVMTSFADVAIDPTNESLVFALSTEGLMVCSFLLSETEETLQLVGCSGTFSVSPFCGVSAYGGTLMISGGTGGFTVYEYDRQTGQIEDSPALLNQRFPGIIGHPDVVLVDSGLAALSTDFSGGSSRFGTQMVTIDAPGASASFGLDYRVQDTLGFDLTVQPANFPLVNAIYRARDGRTIMYTANGPMQVQDLSSSGVAVLTGAGTGFSAVTVAVHQAKRLLIVGGVLSAGGSRVFVYDLSVDPMNPTLVNSQAAGTGERITSIAAGGNVAAFVTTDNPGTIQFLDLPQGAIEVTPPTDSDVTSDPDGNFGNNVFPTEESPPGASTGSSASPPGILVSSWWQAVITVSGSLLAVLLC